MNSPLALLSSLLLGLDVWLLFHVKEGLRSLFTLYAWIFQILIILWKVDLFSKPITSMYQPVFIQQKIHVPVLGVYFPALTRLDTVDWYIRTAAVNINTSCAHPTICSEWTSFQYIIFCIVFILLHLYTVMIWTIRCHPEGSTVRLMPLKVSSCLVRRFFFATVISGFLVFFSKIFFFGAFLRIDVCIQISVKLCCDNIHC